MNFWVPKLTLPLILQLSFQKETEKLTFNPLTIGVSHLKNKYFTNPN